ncbi:MAG: hypothetical protein WCJ84_06460 [Candidatus Peregrinibacteria bacterium]
MKNEEFRRGRIMGLPELGMPIYRARYLHRKKPKNILIVKEKNSLDKKKKKQGAPSSKKETLLPPFLWQ